MASRTFKIVEFSGIACGLADELRVQVLGELTVEVASASGEMATPAPPTPPLPASSPMIAEGVARGVGRLSRALTEPAGLRPHRNKDTVDQGSVDEDAAKRFKIKRTSTAQLARWLKVPGGRGEDTVAGGRALGLCPVRAGGLRPVAGLGGRFNFSCGTATW